MDKENKEPTKVSNVVNSGQRGNRRLLRIQNWPELAEQANWSVGRLAKTCSVSTDTLRRYFLTSINMSLGTWLDKEQQKRAIKMLQAGASVKETSALLGYRNQSNFSRRFKKEYGMCPSVLIGSAARKFKFAAK